MKMISKIKLLGSVAVIVLGFAGNANAISLNVANPERDVRNTEVSPVPEADTWAMMALGVGLVGLRLRRKQQSSVK